VVNVGEVVLEEILLQDTNKINVNKVMKSIV
jgi:hypothetical protein